MRREAKIKETKIRTTNALQAMKAIGIEEDKAGLVLRTLLKLYDKNWALIEDENYRALADAVFERDEIKVEEQIRKNVDNEAQDQLEKEAQEDDNLERPLKMLKLGYRDRQTSTLNTSSTSMPPTPPVFTSQALGQSKGKQPISSNSLVHENGDPSLPSGVNRSQQSVQQTNTPRLPAHRMRLRERAASLQTPPTVKRPALKSSSRALQLKEHNVEPDTVLPPKENKNGMRLGERAASLQTPPKVKRPALKSSSHALQLKEHNVEPDTVLLPKENTNGSHALLKIKDELFTGDMPFEKSKVLADMFCIGDSTNRSSMLIEDCTLEPTTLKSVRERNTADVTVVMYESRNNGELENSRGECSSILEIASSPSAEVKLCLSYKLAPGRPDFHMPRPEAVLKYVEDKCLKSPNDTNISMMGLMEEMCECFLEFGTDLNRQSVIVDATKSSAIGVRGAKASGISSLNGLVDYRSGAKVPQPKAKVLSRQPQLNKLDAEDKIVINRENQGNCTMDGLRLAAVQQPQLSSQIIRPINDVFDIARGQEKFAITLVNEVNDDRPPSFCYIRQNAIYQNAYTNFSLARIAGNSCCSTCSGDCLSLSVPCACSYESGGEFAYTADGVVKEELLEECISMNRDPKKHCQFFCKECPLERSKYEDIIEPCKGHLVRNFVKECWIKCGCNIQCGNRVVQRGISRRLQVFMTPEGKGWGLRTLEDLPKGAFVCEYVGEVLTNAELFERVLRSPEGEKHSYPVLLDADWCAEGVLKDEEALCLDATHYGNVARFINHKCYDSNLVEIPVEVETPDHHYYHLAFFTSRKVKAMEELTWDYGIDFDDHEHPIKAFRCQCGSKFCRNIKRSRSKAGRR